MRKPLLTALAALCAFALLCCKSKDASSPKANQLKVDPFQVSQKHCLDKANEKCAEFSISYPVFSGGDSLSTQALNKSVQGYLLSAVGGNSELPFKQALDSAGLQFIQMYLDDVKDIPEMPGGYSTEITHKVSLLNAKVVTIALDGYSFTGGAHPNPFGLLVSYDLSKGAKPLEILDLVSDTNALRPILETGYKLSKGLKASDPLDQVIYSEIKQLTMPVNVGVAAEGIRFFYNAYEVAPYAVGPSDILLTWEQLGTLADKHKWVD